MVIILNRSPSQGCPIFRGLAGVRYPIIDAVGNRVATARLACNPVGATGAAKLNQIKLVSRRDVPLGEQFTLATSSSVLEDLGVNMTTGSLRAAFGLAPTALYGIDPSVELLYWPLHAAKYKLGISVENGTSYCRSVAR